MVVRSKLFPIILLMLFLPACSAKRVWYRLHPEEEVWFRIDTPDVEMRSDLASCRSFPADVKDVAVCMQAQGYLLIPENEAKLLMVRSLQRKGLNEKGIATELGWDEKQVLRYVDEGYELRYTDSLGRQPVDVLVSVGKPAVKPLIAGLKSRDSLARRQSAEALGEIADPRAVEPLMDLLSDPDALIRRHAVKALGKIKDPRAVDLIAGILSDSGEQWHVRSTAAEALGRIQDPNAVGPLITALMDAHWNVRSQSAKALGSIGDRRAVEPLILALKDRDPAVRGYAAEALGKIRDERAIEPLRAALEDEDRHVRKRAQQALIRIIGEESSKQQNKEHK
jgi:HEAT repeat protein